MSIVADRAGRAYTPMEMITTLAELAELATSTPDLFVRWSRGPDEDTEKQRSKDELTEIELPGLSANSLAMEAWWGDRSPTLWVARRLYDYRHLRERREGQIRPWVMEGEQVGRGPDNEPLVRCVRAIGWIADEVVDEAERLVEGSPGPWGPLDRQGAAGS